MNHRPYKDEYDPYYETYIRLVPEGSLKEILSTQLANTRALLSTLSETQANFRYAEGKWTLKEVIGHITDNERIMSYRVLRIARGDDTPLAGYDQDLLMKGAPFQSAALSQRIEDYTAVRQATLTLLEGLAEEALLRRGVASDNEVSARAIACMIAGHELHHMNIIRDRYLISTI
jgi:hypothetical protein